MKELFIKIRSYFDSKGTDDAQKATGGLTGRLRECMRMTGVLAGGASAFGAGLVSLATTAIAAATSAVQGLGRMVSTAVSEFAEAEVKMTALDQALAQQGKLTDDYRERLSELAGQLQATTAIADDQWLSVLTTLTKFGADSTNIEKYANAVKNLAGFLGGDIEQAAFLFGKAMQGSTDALGRYGIQVDKTKTATEQLNQIMQQLASRGGGQLEAQAKTLSGQWTGLKLSTSDLFEAFGRLISKTGILQGGIGVLNTATSWWAKTLGGTPDLIEGVTNKLRQNKRPVEEAEEVTRKYNAELAKTETASKKAAEQLGSQMRAVGELATAQSKAVSAAGELQLAQLDAKGLTGAARLEAESKIRSDTRARLRQIESEQAQLQINLLQQAVQKAEQEAHERQKTYLDQLAKTEIAEENARQAEKTQAIINNDDKLITRAQQRVDEIKQRLQSQTKVSDAIAPQLEAELPGLEEFIRIKQQRRAMFSEPDPNAAAAAQAERQKLELLGEQNQKLSANAEAERTQNLAKIESLRREQASANQLYAINERTSQIKDALAQKEAIMRDMEAAKATSAQTVKTATGDIAKASGDDAEAQERALAAINSRIAALSNPALTESPEQKFAERLQSAQRNAALNAGDPVAAQFYKEEIANLTDKLSSIQQAGAATLTQVTQVANESAANAQVAQQAVAVHAEALASQFSGIATNISGLGGTINSGVAEIGRAVVGVQDGLQSQIDQLWGQINLLWRR